MIRGAMAGVVRVEAFAELPWLLHGFSTRQGGGSIAYGVGEQNLGWTPEDAAAVVAGNRERFVKAVAGDRAVVLVTVRQVHGVAVQGIEREHGELATAEGKAVLVGDGLMTDVPGVLLGIQTADCVPVMVADRKRRVVGVFHAGWRGTVGRIVELGVGAMRERYGCGAEDLVAAVGPAIGACCFEVGEEVRREFEDGFGYAAELFRDGSASERVHVDLFEANRRELLAAGVAAGKISVVGECSACTRLADGRRKYFSHRAEGGVTGRMLSVVGVEDRG